MPPRRVLKISATRLNLEASLPNRSMKQSLAISHHDRIDHVL